MPYPMHTMAECIDERVNSKVFYERGSPALSRGLGSSLLTDEPGMAPRSHAHNA
jgi:hypothetical protein